MTIDSAGVVPEFTTGDRLRKARELAGYDVQGEFAQLIGVSRGTVSNYERGETQRYKPIVMRAWALATGVSLDWLEHGSSPSTPTPPDGPSGDRQAAIQALAASKKAHGGGGRSSDEYLRRAA